MAEEQPRRFGEHLASNLRAMRGAKRISQEKLGEMMRELGHPWSHSTVSAVEVGKRAVTVDELFGLALALAEVPAALLDPGDQASDYVSRGKPLAPVLARAWARSLLKGYLNNSGDLSFLMALPEDLKVIQLVVADFLERQEEQP
jgi:transcriptional regulator with XRE-family HTH domain